MSEAKKKHEFLKSIMSVVEPGEFIAARNKAADELIEELKKNCYTYGDILNALNDLPIYNFTSEQREIIDTAKGVIENQMRAVRCR
ncbi:hypothetical protein P9D96_08420 [Bacillus mojavensis]|uniref:hypothetical protein n=1 Tax=Bacillus mojavensis TaxID=72360 RepID=UPI002DBA54E7|nr:hypothetical protein [Bacillus mojavensis]MEC1613240.1 hypothetical protein [Bacillus mojavensis]